MFPFDRGDLSPSAYMAVLLIAAIRKSGGELRLPADLLMTIDQGEALHHDYDTRTQELVLRSGTKYAEMLVVAEAPCRPIRQIAPTPQPSPKSSPVSSKAPLAMDDARLAEAEIARQKESLLRRWQQDRDRALNSLGGTPANASNESDENLRNAKGRIA